MPVCASCRRGRLLLLPRLRPRRFGSPFAGRSAATAGAFLRATLRSFCRLRIGLPGRAVRGRSLPRRRLGATVPAGAGAVQVRWELERVRHGLRDARVARARRASRPASSRPASAAASAWWRLLRSRRRRRGGSGRARCRLRGGRSLRDDRLGRHRRTDSASARAWAPAGPGATARGRRRGWRRRGWRRGCGGAGADLGGRRRRRPAAAPDPGSASCAASASARPRARAPDRRGRSRNGPSPATLHRRASRCRASPRPAVAAARRRSGPSAAPGATRARAPARSGPRAAAGRSGTTRRARAAARVRAPARRCSRGGPRSPGSSSTSRVARGSGGAGAAYVSEGWTTKSGSGSSSTSTATGRRGSGGGSNVVTGAGVPGRRGAFAHTPVGRDRRAVAKLVAEDRPVRGGSGGASTNSTSRGTLSSGSVCRRCWRISATRRSEPVTPGASTTKARTYWPPRWRSRMPTTPACTTERCPTRACSTSKGLNLLPPLVITSDRATEEADGAVLLAAGEVARQVQVAAEDGLRLFGARPSSR